MLVVTRIIFRADASTSIGAGHIKRCLSLAAKFRQNNADVHFICREITDNLTEEMRSLGYQLHRFVESEDEAQDILERISQVDLLVVDHYELDQVWESKARSFVKKIFVIDDLANRSHDCDVLLDQNLNRVASDYKQFVPKHCRLLIGPKYALLAESYLRKRFPASLKKGKNTKKPKLLISMGGSDLYNVTEFVLEALTSYKHTLEITALMKGTFVRNGYPHTVRVVEHINDLSGLILDADIAIGAGGITAYERCCLGLPTLIITTAENQEPTATALDHCGAAKYLGSFEKITKERLIASLDQLIADAETVKKMQKIALNVCDGYGVSRVLSELSADAINKVQLRPATMNDAELILEWQQDPSTRQYARNISVPTREEHFKWMFEKLSDPGCLFNIVLYDDKPAGVLRYDYMQDKNHYFEISILISPTHRRLGIAKAALKIGRQIFYDLSFYAEVHPDNKPSRDLFLQAGYMSCSSKGYVEEAHV